MRELRAFTFQVDQHSHHANPGNLGLHRQGALVGVERCFFIGALPEIPAGISDMDSI